MSAAVENLLLEAVHLGRDAVWMGIAPVDLFAFAIVPCGYPAEERPQQDRFDEKRAEESGLSYRQMMENDNIVW